MLLVRIKKLLAAFSSDHFPATAHNFNLEDMTINIHRFFGLFIIDIGSDDFYYSATGLASEFCQLEFLSYPIFKIGAFVYLSYLPIVIEVLNLRAVLQLHL
jgi:hypothetical protein